MSEKTQRVAIVGGGLVGALNACFFAKKGWNVDLYEFREDIRTWEHVPGRSINLALSHRGRTALAAVGLEQYIVDHGVPMHARLVHDKSGSSTNALPYGRPGQFILSINRRELNEVMLTEAEQHTNVRIFFQHKLKYVKLSAKELVFDRLTDGKIITASADLICGCDGAYSALRQSLMKVPGFDYSQEYIPHGYLEFSILPSVDNKFKMEPNFFHLWPRGNFCLIALANRDKTFTVTLFAPLTMFDSWKGREKKFIEFFEASFPDALTMIGREQTLNTFKNVKPSQLVSIKCSPFHFGDCVVLLGDAAHAMVPFYGQGMNCGFEDCLVLHELLQKHRDNIEGALKEYTAVRCVDAHAINDLAMYNYSELKDLVNKHGFLWRKSLDYLLNLLMPISWIPLYSMVTFTRIRYHEIILRRKKQDKILKIAGISLAAIGAGFTGYFMYKHFDRVNSRIEFENFLNNIFDKW